MKKMTEFQELHEAFKNHHLILTAAISADKATIDKGYDIPEMSKYLDYIHVMAYDYHGAWDKKVLSNAPLNCDDGLCIVNRIVYRELYFYSKLNQKSTVNHFSTFSFIYLFFYRS